MCNYFCSNGGRGHLHTVPCLHKNDPSKCEPDFYYGKIVQKHCNNNKYGINEYIDEQTHDAYWRKMGFKDPWYNNSKLQLFRQCNAYCTHRSHDNELKKSFCELELWHDDVKDDRKINEIQTYTIANGHRFSCKHPKPAHVYVIAILYLIFYIFMF